MQTETQDGFPSPFYGNFMLIYKHGNIHVKIFDMPDFYTVR